MRPPFYCLFHQEPLPWFDGQISGSVIQIHAHGHNRPTHDETSYSSASTLSAYVSHGSPFITENIFTTFSGIPG
jgi:hypothetical protein